LLDEQQRRLFARLEALQFDAKDRWIADLLGVNVQTVAKGRQALLERDILLSRSRRPGGGRKPSEKNARNHRHHRSPDAIRDGGRSDLGIEVDA
jgi:hypothetical protein